MCMKEWEKRISRMRLYKLLPWFLRGSSRLITADWFGFGLRCGCTVYHGWIVSEFGFLQPSLTVQMYFCLVVYGGDTSIAVVVLHGLKVWCYFKCEGGMGRKEWEHNNKLTPVLKLPSSSFQEPGLWGDRLVVFFVLMLWILVFWLCVCVCDFMRLKQHKILMNIKKNKKITLAYKKRSTNNIYETTILGGKWSGILSFFRIREKFSFLSEIFSVFWVKNFSSWISCRCESVI